MHQPQENGRPKRSLVLKYANRRYDGGSEIELIREIERKHAIRQLIRLQHLQMERQRGSLLPVEDFLDEDAPKDNSAGCAVAALPSPLQEAPPSHLAPRSQPVATVQPGRKPNLIVEALIMGPMEICVGMVGMLTSLLAIVTFSYTKNPALSQQSKIVFRDCFRTFFKGWFDTLTGPGKAIHRAVTG